MAGALVKSWSTRQATVALSSPEAELYAASKSTAELMGMVSLMADLAWEVVAVRRFSRIRVRLVRLPAAGVLAGPHTFK